MRWFGSVTTALLVLLGPGAPASAAPPAQSGAAPVAAEAVPVVAASAVPVAAASAPASAPAGSGTGRRGSAPSWSWPVGDGSPAAVVRRFDPPETRYSAGHRGVDLAVTPGAPVRAAAAGRVSYTGLLAGRGVVVVVHGELRTTYEPVAAEVAVGQQVRAGQVLGRLAGEHAGCGTCLHWGVRRGEDYLDPLSLVGGGPVRLLPLVGLTATAPGRADAAEGSVHPRAAPVAEAVAAARPSKDGSLPAPELSLRSATGPAGAGVLLALLFALSRRGAARRRTR